MTVKLLTEHHLEFLSLKGGCTGSSASTLVKMRHCWKSHAAAQMMLSSLIKPIKFLLFKTVTNQRSLNKQNLSKSISCYSMKHNVYNITINILPGPRSASPVLEYENISYISVLDKNH